ncbi:phosphoribosyl-AMP cyclohydrolase [Candidatus Vidania fulgoroideorum]
MLAWINRLAFIRTCIKKYTFFFSRRRKMIWNKGGTSGNFQRVVYLYVDCDSDSFLLSVRQVNKICCHRLRQSCFYKI